VTEKALIAEAKGIYLGLAMVESKCIEITNAQLSFPPNTRQPLTGDQWQTLIALFRTLLHEHHDFLLVSQHPSATPRLHRLASKYAMPDRMRRHGVAEALMLFRHHLPHSLEYILYFWSIAYSMLALFYETVPAFEARFTECLGDLSRSRCVSCNP